MADTLVRPWRADPGLANRFHPDYPDDLEVICHDGEPRRTGRAPEICWVRVTGAAPGPPRPVVRVPGRDAAFDAALRQRPWGALDRVYAGTLLNAPHALTSVRAGDAVRFVVAPGLPHPLLVTPAYLAERPAWDVAPCDRCGFAEALDPPSVMARTRFPTAPVDARVEQFTAFCPQCGGTQLFATRDGGR